MNSPPETESLVSEERSVSTLAEPEIAAMWGLYSHYYSGTREALFRSDLSEKTDVILSRDHLGAVRGFSTIQISDVVFRGKKITVIFSGDTIIDHRYWAKNDFAFAWIRFAASVMGRAPEKPLYWLLIVKGHRTYRYLSVFSQRYYPGSRWETPASFKNLMDSLASERFGDAYDPESGLVCFKESHGHLKAEWAEVPESARTRPEVAFFLERNPGFAKGDELVCLCEVSEANMKRMTLRVFKQGLEHPDPAPDH
jgi:hypothetical protein